MFVHKLLALASSHRYHLVELRKDGSKSNHFWSGNDFETAFHTAHEVSRHVKKQNGPTSVIGIHIHDAKKNEVVRTIPTINSSPETQHDHRVDTHFGWNSNDLHITSPKSKTEAKEEIPPENLPFDDKEFIDHHNTLTPEQKLSINRYKTASFHLNRTLRHKKENIPAFYRDIKNIDNVTSRGIKQPLTVYRGISEEFKEPNEKPNPKLKLWHSPEALTPGTRLHDLGFTGTSLDSGIAMNNAKHRARERIHYFQIHLPVGTKAHYLDHSKSDSGMKYEREVLLNRGHVFEVTHHSTPDDHSHIVHLKIVDHKPEKFNKQVKQKALAKKGKHFNDALSEYKSAITDVHPYGVEDKNEDLEDHYKNLEEFEKEGLNIDKYKKAYQNKDKVNMKDEYKKREEKLKTKLYQNLYNNGKAYLNEIEEFANHHKLPHSKFVLNFKRDIPKFDKNIFEKDIEHCHKHQIPMKYLVNDYLDHVEEHGLSVPEHIKKILGKTK